ncbi:hypothetical protein RV04_GL001279 [Enterococcus hermanniensis]|uniref:Isochorismatase-like domain-containing protein n=2 Tax=Enterococcus hermanniensis TaxID=249189 RepID=A0A1L8TPF8_9ENTE|nr:hypothetical protein RV04_GL001279 [Enterococcus hermanniensis]
MSPYTNEEILSASNKLANFFKHTDALIVLVNVDGTTFSYLHPSRINRAEETPFPKLYTELSMDIAKDEAAKNVIQITKHNPGAFFGTDLDLQLRRRGIDTIILSGVSTSNGVYATALDAFQYGYKLYIVEDATADRDTEMHNLFFKKLYPKLGSVIKLSDILELETHD